MIKRKISLWIRLALIVIGGVIVTIGMLDLPLSVVFQLAIFFIGLGLMMAGFYGIRPAKIKKGH